VHLVSTLCTPSVLRKLSPLATVSLHPSLQLKEKWKCVSSPVGSDPKQHLEEWVSGTSLTLVAIIRPGGRPSSATQT